jgi:hypothetical protein
MDVGDLVICPGTKDCLNEDDAFIFLLSRFAQIGGMTFLFHQSMMIC